MMIEVESLLGCPKFLTPLFIFSFLLLCAISLIKKKDKLNCFKKYYQFWVLQPCQGMK